MVLGSGIRDPGSGIRDPGSGIRKKPIPDPGSRGQKGTGSRIRIRNTDRNPVTSKLSPEGRYTTLQNIKAKFSGFFLHGPGSGSGSEPEYSDQMG
jgi:hypothetical protein